MKFFSSTVIDAEFVIMRANDKLPAEAQ